MGEPARPWCCPEPRCLVLSNGEHAYGETAPIAVALVVQRLLQRRGELPIDDKLAEAEGRATPSS